MTWHQWHQTAEIDSRMGLSSAAATANASSDQGCHPISAARFGRGEKWNSLTGPGYVVSACSLEKAGESGTVPTASLTAAMSSTKPASGRGADARMASASRKGRDRKS